MSPAFSPTFNVAEAFPLIPHRPIFPIAWAMTLEPLIVRQFEAFAPLR
jgi:hypothetical protein